jgi:hypothetical protein
VTLRRCWKPPETWSVTPSMQATKMFHTCTMSRCATVTCLFLPPTTYPCAQFLRAQANAMVRARISQPAGTNSRTPAIQGQPSRAGESRPGQASTCAVPWPAVRETGGRPIVGDAAPQGLRSKSRSHLVNHAAPQREGPGIQVTLDIGSNVALF